MRVFEKAYAKINLFLDVTARRSDGFHEIKSIMQTVSLCDDLDITVMRSEKNEISLSVLIDDELCSYGTDKDALSAVEDNLVYKAARLYLERAGIFAKVEMTLKKSIPIAAGLAGGSADAAAALRGLNKILGAFSEKELSGLSAELGSDIPFCLVGGTALCTGRGEKIVALPYTPPMFMAVAIGSGRISAAKAYGALDTAFSNFDGTTQSIGQSKIANVEAALSGDAIEQALLDISEYAYNIFEYSGVRELREVEKIKGELIGLGASVALMSGSGPSVFGIFGTQREAEAAVDKLKAGGTFAVLARTVG